MANAVAIQADLCAFLDLAIPNSNRIPMLNKAHRPVMGKHKAFYNYLLQGRAPKAARALLKKFPYYLSVLAPKAFGFSPAGSG